MTAGVILLIIHFTIVGLSLLPDNPIKHQMKYEIRSYMEPIFTQTWNLFSPTPINTNMTVLIQFKLYNAGKIDSTEWVDIYEPLIKEKRASFWSPVQRISKFMTSCMQNVLESNNNFVKMVQQDSTLRTDSVKSKLLYDRHMSVSFGHTSLIQYSNYVLLRMKSASEISGADSIMVRYEIFNAKFPRFSKREIDFYDLKSYKFNKMTSKFYKL
ncbi:hypothetical protein BH10PSE19_BH10PSE19_19390 [soil metagenome]